MHKTIYECMNSEGIANITKSFAYSTGMGVVLTDVNGRHISQEINFCDFCQLMNRESAQQCYRSNKFALEVAVQTGKPFVFVCHAGLVDMIAPIKLNNRVIGSLMAGQIRVDADMHLPRAGVHGMMRMNASLSDNTISKTTYLRLHACSQMLLAVAEAIGRQLVEARQPSRLGRSHVNRPSDAALAPFTDTDLRAWLRHNYAVRRWLDVGEIDRAKTWILNNIELTRYLCAPHSATLDLRTQCEMVNAYIRLQTGVDDSQISLELRVQPDIMDWSLPVYFLLDLIADGLAGFGGHEASCCMLSLQSSRKGKYAVLSIKDLGRGFLPLFDDKQTWTLFTADQVLAENFAPAFKKALFNLLSGGYPYHVEIHVSPGIKQVDIMCDTTFKNQA